jgi:ribA/ribD-fused uncharacterized protein
MKEFKGDYRFLSNFWSCKVLFRDIEFNCVEIPYQAAKATTMEDFAYVADSRTPGESKRRSKQIILVENWDSIKVDIMRTLLISKFSDKMLRAKLMATKPHILEEGNTWGDIFWGISPPRSGIGENMLGHLLMEIRDGRETGTVD